MSTPWEAAAGLDEREPGYDARCDAEITPEMIEAGADILSRMKLPFATEAYWARKIYRAMYGASPQARANESLRASENRPFNGCPPFPL